MSRSLYSIPSTTEAYMPRLVLQEEYSGGPDSGMGARHSRSTQYWDLEALPEAVRRAFAEDRENHVRPEPPRAGDGLGKIRAARYQQRQDRILHLPGQLHPLVWRAPYKARLTKGCRRSTRSYLAFNLYRDKRVVDIEIVPTHEAKDEMGWNEALLAWHDLIEDDVLRYLPYHEAGNYLQLLPPELARELQRFVGLRRDVHPVWSSLATWCMSYSCNWGTTYDFLWWYFGVKQGRTLSTEQERLFSPTSSPKHQLVRCSGIPCAIMEEPNVDIMSL